MNTYHAAAAEWDISSYRASCGSISWSLLNCLSLDCKKDLWNSHSRLNLNPQILYLLIVSWVMTELGTSILRNYVVIKILVKICNQYRKRYLLFGFVSLNWRNREDILCCLEFFFWLLIWWIARRKKKGNT